VLRRSERPCKKHSRAGKPAFCDIQALPWVANLAERLEFALRRLSFPTETPRREFLIAPILFELALHYNFDIRTEYDIRVNKQLKGTLDYFLEAQNSLVVIEAKHADMSRGCTQLCAEMIAVDQWTDSPTPILYGVITFGDIWRFVILERATQKIVQDVHLYTLPDNTEQLIRLLVGIVRTDADTVG
jgi:hypothetical protein